MVAEPIRGIEMHTEELRASWLSVAAVCVVVAGGYGFIDTRSTLWDRDEPRFSRATAEMIESGNYLYPTFNGQLRPDKPILIYWLMSVPMRLLGPTSLACRFFSSVGVVITCLLTFLLARQFLGVKAGLWSMAVLPSTLMVMVEGTAATADGVLLATMVVVIVLFASGLASGWRWYHAIGMGVSLGLGLLAKGPVALLSIAVIVSTLWLVRRNEVRVWSQVGQLGGATVLGVLLFIAWAVPANQATGGEFLRLGLGHHVLARTARPLEHHGGDFLLHLPYYLPVIIAGFFPWTLHLPGSISAVINRRVGSSRFRELFLAWVVSIVVIMTLVATKLPHYILFIWPALALAVGGTLAAASQGRLADADRRWLRGGVWFFGPVAGAMAIGLLAAPFVLHLPGGAASFGAAAFVLLTISVLAVRRQLQDRPQASAIILLVGTVVVQIPLMLGVMPVLEKAKIAVPLADAVKRATPADVPVATFGYREPTLNFYVGRYIEPLGSPEAVATWARRSEPGVLILPRTLLTAIEQQQGPLGLTTIASKRGLSYSNGKTQEVVAMQRGKGDE
jgi:4-amino-4-deoxy-L-arabinose transferase-like glycosyltransferase